MSLYCDMGDLADFYVSDVRRARKSYRCDECGGPINPGEEYERAFMVYSREPSIFLTCAACLPMAEWVLRNCGCRIHGDLWRHLEEDVFGDMLGELPPGVHFKVGRWLVESRRRRGVVLGAAR